MHGYYRTEEGDCSIKLTYWLFWLYIGKLKVALYLYLLSGWTYIFTYSFIKVSYVMSGESA